MSVIDMKTNRKKADTYRFTGLWGMGPMGIAELKIKIKTFRAKLEDPADPDDKKWTARWLRRFEQELAKKHRSLELTEYTYQICAGPLPPIDCYCASRSH